MAAANCLNIPLMRRLELQDGIMLETKEGELVGTSKIAAKEGIGMVTVSRIAMAMPGGNSDRAKHCLAWGNLYNLTNYNDTSWYVTFM